MNFFKIYCITMITAILAVGYIIYTVQPERDNTQALAIEEAKKGDETISPSDLSSHPSFPSPKKTVYQMGLYLDINNRILYGNTTLNTENTSGKILQELWFTAYPNAFKKAKNSPAPSDAYFAGFDEGWLEFSEIKVNGKSTDYVLDEVSVQVLPDEALLPDEPIIVEMEWRVKIPKVAYRFGTKDNVFMLGNFYPTLNVLGEEWHNSYNSLFGDPFCFHTADYLVRLNTPEVYNIVATGNTLQRVAEDNGRQTHIIEARSVRDFSLTVLYNYAEVSKISGTTRINAYLPNNTKIDDLILDKASAMMDYYSLQFGSYPYPDFNIVFVPMQGFHGMEYSGLIFLRDEFLLSNFDQNRLQFILAHEIAHQWWYAMVGNDQLKEPWLDEGLANWSAYKCLQEVKGQEITFTGSFRKKVNLAKELKDIYSTPEYYQIAYTDGEAFWFSLEEELGTDTVVKILRSYLSEYKFEIATTMDLFTIIKAEASQDMDEFLDKWFRP